MEENRKRLSAGSEFRRNSVGARGEVSEFRAGGSDPAVDRFEWT